MPIPQMQSKFSSRKIGDSPSSQPTSGFSHHRISSSPNTRKPHRPGRFLYKRKKVKEPRTPRGPRSSKWYARTFKKLLPYAIGLVLILGIALAGMVAYYDNQLPDVGTLLIRNSPQSTKIYDRTGEELLFEIHGDEQRTHISLVDLPPYVYQATIAIEDKNFYNHSGISVWGIIRGQIVPRLQGRRAQGGSTLTQQFIKNAILTNERSITRKIKEWILSFRLEAKFSKDEILEFYMNEIPYGGATYGVESAARYYFDKPAAELTIAEAALLAALPQAPTYYSPYGSNKDTLIGRQQYTLDQMAEQGYITQEQANEAKEQELVFRQRIDKIKAPHFVMYVRELLEQQYGTRIIEESGWKITTTLDYEKQEIAQAAVDEIAPGNLEDYNASNASLVSIDVGSGDILAMIGSKDYFDDEIDGQVNVATSLRQPGSSLKPFVYMASFIRGYSPNTILFDIATNFASGGRDYVPKNYDLVDRGPITMRSALALSLNVPAVKALYLAGVNNVIELAKGFGYTSLTDPDRYGLSLVLGGAEVKLIEHTNAYAALARDGVFKQSRAILKIEDAEGNIVEDYDESNEERVVDRKFVRQLTDVLTDNDARAATFGQSNYLILGGRPVAAKTGTTDDYRDAWTMGYTPEIATGVWVGNNDNTPMERGAGGSRVAAPIWNKYMREALANVPISGFPPAEFDECEKPMVCGADATEIKVEIDTMSGKLATEYTPYTTREEKSFRNTHSILHFVDRNDPLGPIPADPGQDPQYSLWEAPISKWAEEQGFLNEAPPTEEDDIHLPHLRPTVNITSPSNNQTINSASFTIESSASAPRGVQRVEYFIDGEKVGQSSASSYSFTHQLNPFIANGRHELKAIAFDDQDNFSEDIISININLDSSARNFNVVWLNPENGDNIPLSSIPFQLSLNIDRPDNISKIDFYYLNPENESKYLGFISAPASNVSMTMDDAVGAGVHKFYMVIQDAGGNIITTPGIIVNFTE